MINLRTHSRHFTMYVGSTYNLDHTVVYRVAYGALQNVYAEKACNYSYREFWI